MTYCQVDSQVREHAHNEGLKVDKEMVIEERAKEILNDFLNGDVTSIDERFLTYFEESGYVWKIVEIMNLKSKGCDEEVEKVLDSMLNDLRDIAGKFAENAAEDYIK